MPACSLRVQLLPQHCKRSALYAFCASLQFKPVSPSDAPANAQCVEATLKQPIAAGDVATIDTVAVLADAQVPYPAEITQQDTQLVLFNNNVYVTSPYSVSTQTTEVLTHTHRHTTESAALSSCAAVHNSLCSTTVGSDAKTSFSLNARS